MKDRKLEDIIKNKLASFEADRSGMDWSALKNQLDFPIIEDDENFDNTINDRLRDYKAPYNSDHWVILRDTLRRNKALRTAINRIKSMELLIAVFLFFLMASYFNVDQLPTPSHYASEDTHEVDADKTHYDAGAFLQIIKSILLQDLTLSQINKKPHQATGTTQHQGSATINNRSTSPLDRHSTVINENAIQPTASTRDDANEQVVLPPMAIMENLPQPESRLFSIPEEIEFRKTLLERNENLETTQEIILKEKQPQPKKFISLAGGLTYNIIQSPYDPVYKMSPYESAASNYQITFNYGRTWDRLEAFTGLKYMHIAYAPLHIEEVYSFSIQQRKQYAITLDRNEFDVLSIPVGIRANVFKSDRHRVFAGISLDNNFVVHTDYAFSVYDYLNPSNSYNIERVSPSSNLSRKPFNDGIIGGGSILDNYYLSASAGIGYTFRFTKGLELAVMVDYYHTTASLGIGPNRDLVNGFSFDFGLRKNI